MSAFEEARSAQAAQRRAAAEAAAALQDRRVERAAVENERARREALVRAIERDVQEVR